MGEHKNKFKLVTSRELADLIVELIDLRSAQNAVCLLHSGEIKLVPLNDAVEMKIRKLADALKALYPPGGVAVYGKNDSPKL